MIAELTNNWLIVPEGAIPTISLKSLLTFREPSRIVRTKKRKITIPESYMYCYAIKGNKVYIPVGLYPLLSEYFTLETEIVDHRTQNDSKIITNVTTIIDCINEYADILPGITLRPEQLIACRKILYAKRGIINAATGFGKSEVICATCSMLQKANEGVMPTVLIFEPTIKLVTDMHKRFKKYGIDSVIYSDERKIVPNTINIAHPKSLGNDLQNDPTLLASVEVLFGDETHHMVCDTYRTPTYEMSNLIYSIGVSASAISQEHVRNTQISQYDYNEVMVIGATGPLLLNITADYLISKGDLAKPVLFRLDHKADEEIAENAKTDWHEVSKVKLNSNKRNFLVCRVAEEFARRGRKVLILVNTIEWSERLLQFFSAMGMYDKVFATYGGGKFEKITNDYVPKLESGYKDSFDRFDNGEYNIMIGTTHLYEGADIKNLDTIILAYGGKCERLQIQGLGRALRKSKTGKYAYVIDFTDSEDLVLSKHSKTRLKRYRETIGIPENNIYDNLNIKDIPKILANLEGI